MILHLNVDPSFGKTGGNIFQTTKTVEWLNKIGVKADYGHWNSKLDFKKYDLFHIYGLNVFWAKLYYETAKKLGKPYVVTPIYLENNQVELKLQQEILNNARKIIIAGKKEIEYMACELNVPNKCVVVNNGTDVIETKSNKEKTVLVAARVEHRKNIYNVIKAAKEMNIGIKVIGSIMKGYWKDEEDYYKKCLSLNYGEILGHQNPIPYYRQADTLIIASYREIDPLVFYEAAMCDCKIMLTKECGIAEEYKNFKDVKIIDPIYFKTSDIKEMVKRPLTGDLKKYIKNNHLWLHTVKKLVEVYKEVV